MTKYVRIENADQSDFKISVEVWDKTAAGDKLVNTIDLDYPTAMINEYLTSSRYFVIKEKPKT
jgi:hypothetical protein